MAVYAVVARIPAGQVATYGLVAFLAGRPRASRIVGCALALSLIHIWDRSSWEDMYGAS